MYIAIAAIIYHVVKTHMHMLIAVLAVYNGIENHLVLLSLSWKLSVQ